MATPLADSSFADSLLAGEAAQPGVVRRIVAQALSPGEWQAMGGYAGEVTQQQIDLLARWEKVVSTRSGSPEGFARRLDYLALDRAQALRRLTTPELPTGCALPPWAEVLESVLNDEAPGPFETASEDTSQPFFPGFVGPFVKVFLSRCHIPAALAAESARDSLCRALTYRLSWTCARTLAHELKLAKASGRVADAPEHRLELLTKYSVLARFLSELTLQFADVTNEVLARLAADHQQISDLFNGGTGPGRIDLFQVGLSDPHCGGRSAWMLRFESGLRLIYKPRSLAVDEAYRTLSAWFNDALGWECFRTAKVLCGDGYGWAEFIQAAPCLTQEGVGRFYRRQGAQAALLYFLCGQDFHAENFVAAGEFPVAIDLEGILAPGIAAPPPELSRLPLSLRPLQFSASATMMLPYWRGGDAFRPLFQASGIGGSGQRPWPVKQPRWSGLGTDTFTVQYGFQDFRFDDSLPVYENAKVAPHRYLPELEDGFAEVYRTVIARKEDLPGVLQPFRTIESRLIFRDTQDYSNLLFWTTAPDLLTSGAAQDVALEMLAGGVPVFQNGFTSPAIVEEEKRALWQRDIPVGYGTPDGTDTRIDRRRSYGPVVPVAPFEQMRAMIRAASDEELAWQLGILRATLRMADDGARMAVGETVESKPGRLLEYAAAIGSELERIAVEYGEDLGWLSLVRFSGGASRVYAVPYDPWSLTSSAGNAIFLANLARATGEQRFGQLARRALASAVRSLSGVWKESWRSNVSVAAYGGSFGLVYALTCAGAQLEDETLLQLACDVASWHNIGDLRREANPDFLTGAAGALAALCGLYRKTHKQPLLDQAIALSEAITKAAVDGGRNGWQVPFFARPLLGMAHGSAGIAAALLALYRETGDSSLLQSALAGFEHERKHFHLSQADWPNLQEPEGRTSFMTGWCAGAPGIGLSRLIARQAAGANASIDKKDIDREIELAIAATRKHTGSGPHHLCCGEAGRIVFLASAGAALEKQELQTESIDAAFQITEQFEREKFWRLQEFCEILALPGLPGGVPGIGLAFLTAVAPSLCSEVLTLS